METDVALTRTPTASSSAKTKSADDAHLQEKKPNVNEGASESDLTGAGNSDAEKTEIAPINGDEHEHITGLNLLFVMATLALSCFLIMLDTSIISTAIPRITSQFQSLPDIGWYTAAYQLASASLQPLSGKLYTHFKAKWTFLVFFFIFQLGSLVCGLASSSNMLIGGRAIAGVGASGIIVGGMTIIAGAVSLEKRALYTGLLIGIAQLGLVCGPVIGGALTQYVTWRWCFYINLPMGALLAVVLVIVKTPDLTVKEPFSLSLVRKTIPELDLVGFSLFAPAVIMILLALQWGGTKYAWSNSVIIGLFCGGAAGAAIFIFWERRQGDRAMVPGSIVKQRIVWSSAFNGMSLMTMMYTASQFLPIYFQAIKGEDPAASGVDVLPSILSQLLTVVGSGALLQRVGYYMPFAIVSSVISAIGNGLVSTYNPWTETARWAGYQFFLGAGRGIGMQIGLVAMQNVLTPDQIPAGLAFLVFCQNMAAAVFVVVGTVVFTQSLVSELAIHAPSVNPEAALAAGASASAVRALVPAGGSELDGVLVAFSNSFDRVFYLLVGCSIVGFVSAFGMGWINIRKKKVKEGGDA